MPKHVSEVRFRDISRAQARGQLRDVGRALLDLADAVGELAPGSIPVLLVEAGKVVAQAEQLARIARGVSAPQPGPTGEPASTTSS